MEKIKNSKEEKRYPGMGIPDHFFVDFQLEMERKIDRFEAGKRFGGAVGRSKRRLSIGRRIMLACSVAACVCLLIGIFPLMRSVVDHGFQEGEMAVSEIGTAELQDQEVQDMMLATLSDYDIYMNYYYEE